MAAADVIVKTETFLDNEYSCGDASLLDTHSGYNFDEREENDDYKMQQLLREFDLEILHTILKLGDITFRSLKYLSENDINEAIRSIAYRAEFREKLFAWRRDKFGFNDISVLPPTNGNNAKQTQPRFEAPTSFSHLNKNTTLFENAAENNKRDAAAAEAVLEMPSAVSEVPAAKKRKFSSRKTSTATTTPRSSPSPSISNPPFKENLTSLPRDTMSPLLSVLPSTSAASEHSLDHISSYNLQPTTSAQAKALSSSAVTAIDAESVFSSSTASMFPKLGRVPNKFQSENVTQYINSQEPNLQKEPLQGEDTVLQNACYENVEQTKQLTPRVESLEQILSVQVTAFNQIKVAFDKVLFQLENGSRNVNNNPTGPVDVELNTILNSLLPIKTVKQFDELDKKLADENMKMKVIEKLKDICGTGGKSDGKNSAYRLLDVVFSRQFFGMCSLFGGTKSAHTNCGIRPRKNVYDLFFQLVKKADSGYSFELQDQFFVSALKNKKARLSSAASSLENSGMLKVSKKRSRPSGLLYKSKQHTLTDELNEKSPDGPNTEDRQTAGMPTQEHRKEKPQKKEELQQTTFGC